MQRCLTIVNKNDSGENEETQFIYSKHIFICAMF